MKTMSLRALSREAPAITEAVLVLHDRRIIGTYRPVDSAEEAEPYRMIRPTMKEASMDDTARKAIESDQAKVSRGKISKGLGEMPGEPKREVIRDPGFGSSKPAPKPGK